MDWDEKPTPNPQSNPTLTVAAAAAATTSSVNPPPVHPPLSATQSADGPSAPSTPAARLSATQSAAGQSGPLTLPAGSDAISPTQSSAGPAGSDGMHAAASGSIERIVSGAAAQGAGGAASNVTGLRGATVPVLAASTASHIQVPTAAATGDAGAKSAALLTEVAKAKVGALPTSLTSMLLLGCWTPDNVEERFQRLSKWMNHRDFDAPWRGPPPAELLQPDVMLQWLHQARYHRPEEQTPESSALMSTLQTQNEMLSSIGFTAEGNQATIVAEARKRLDALPCVVNGCSHLLNLDVCDRMTPQMDRHRPPVKPVFYERFASSLVFASDLSARRLGCFRPMLRIREPQIELTSDRSECWDEKRWPTLAAVLTDHRVRWYEMVPGDTEHHLPGFNVINRWGDLYYVHLFYFCHTIGAAFIRKHMYAHCLPISIANVKDDR